MTSCFGYATSNELYFWADSLITYFNSTLPPTVTFFEEFDKSTEWRGFESALKIVPISKNAVVAFAGEMRAIDRVLHFLTSNIETLDLRNIARHLDASLKPWTLGDCELLIGVYDSAVPYLTKWNSNSNVDPPQPVEAIGLGKPLAFPIARLIAQLVESESDVIIAAVTTYLQSLGVRGLLQDARSGGAIVAGVLGARGFRWQPDTTYILYDSTELGKLDFYRSSIKGDGAPFLRSIRNVSVYSRENCITLISRSPSFEGKILYDRTITPNLQDWRSRNIKSIIQDSMAPTSNFYSFIPRDRNTATILQSRNRTPILEPFELHSNATTADIRIHEKFAKILSRDSPAGDAYSIDIHYEIGEPAGA